MKKLCLAAWRWSWVVTLPLCIVASYWAWLAATEYVSFDLRYGMGVPTHPLHDRGLRVWERIERGVALGFFAGERSSGLRRISLAIPESERARLDARLPHSGFDYVEGLLWTERGAQRVEVRYRGDYPMHWGYAKKSLRIKTSRNELFDGMRRFNLIVPKFSQQVNNHLGYRLASFLGVLAPRSEMVELILNGRRAGVHVLVEQLDEGTLRRAGLMPGDLYAGDLIARGEWPGESNLVFDAPGLWEKQATNNRFPDSRASLDALVRLANQPASEELHAELTGLLDLEAFGRFAAAEILMQSFHTNASHNWRLYYDPWRGRFLPIVWDPNAWAGLWHHDPEGLQFSMDLDLTRLHALLLTNARFLDARRRALGGFLGGETGQSFLAEVDTCIRAVELALASDPNHYARYPDLAIEEMRDLPNRLRALFREVEAEHLAESATWYSVTDTGRLRIAIDGRGVFARVAIVLDRPPDRPVRAVLRFLRDGEPRVAEPPVAIRGREALVDVRLVAQLMPIYSAADAGYVIHGRVPLRTVCDIELPDLPREIAIAGVQLHASDGSMQWARRCADLPMAPTDHVFGLTPQTGPHGPRAWSGRVDVQGVQEIDDDLYLQPGTVVRLAPDAGLILGGQLIARGTASEPIRFVSADPNRPWAVVALQGKGCDGSRIEHCFFENGSGLDSGDGMFEYSGMLSIHGADGVTVTHVSFRNNHRVDDMVHAVYSRIDFRHCDFAGAKFDALDLDACTGSIDSCTFEDSGNDGIDLMSSHFVVTGCTFDRCGDKGISVGEGSELVAVDCVFDRCLFGLQVKEACRALVGNCDFLANTTAIDSYLKNWRYGAGGRVRATKCVFFGNDLLAAADRQSSIHLYDCAVQPLLDVDDRQVHVDATVDQSAAREPRAPGFGPLAEEIAELRRSERLARWQIDPTRRGAAEKP